LLELPPSRTFILSGRVRVDVLTAVVDRSGRGGTRKVKATFEEVAARYAEHGHQVAWPVSAEIVSMAIMGATKSKDSSHTLFVSVRAVESGVLDGLIAHEMGHMIRTESGHPSHSAEVFRTLSREVRIPRAAEGAFGQAFNHIQDIYADDLAFLVFSTDGDDRAYEFFSGWIEGNATMRGRNRWKNVGLAATNGFALGNLVRHGRLSKDDALWDRARAFDREAGLEAVGALADFYAHLPENPSPEEFVGQVNALATLMTRAAAV
jgi:hypothetical protein